MWGGGCIAIATGGWAASRAAAGRVRAGPDIRRGAAAALDGATRAAGGPAGTVPRPAPRRSSPRPSPALLAPRPGRGGARRTLGRAELWAPTGSQPPPPEPRLTAPLSPPTAGEVCGQKQDGPVYLWFRHRERAGHGDGVAARGHRIPRPLGPVHAPPILWLGRPAVARLQVTRGARAGCGHWWAAEGRWAGVGAWGEQKGPPRASPGA